MCIPLYVKLIWCSRFCRDLCWIGGGGGVSLPWVYVHSSICETYLLYRFSIYPCWIGGGGGVSMPWVYEHSSICESYLV